MWVIAMEKLPIGRFYLSEGEFLNQQGLKRGIILVGHSVGVIISRLKVGALEDRIIRCSPTSLTQKVPKTQPGIAELRLKKTWSTPSKVARRRRKRI
jgi:hypothetical protein